MKNKIIIAIIIIFIFISCGNIINKKEYDYYKNIDSIKVEHILIKDSLTHIIDSINEELFIAKYKLERIKYYNNIAGKNNNIKFLRGWINRVINE